MLDLRKAIHTYDITTTKQLGKTFGCRAFGKHELVSSDFDIVRQVLMKDFVCFANRTNFIAPNPKNEHNVMQNLLILKEEENWKRIRSLISPAFSITNVKKQIPIYNECSKEFLQLLDCYASQNEKILLHDVLSRLTLSIGAKCAFGIDINILSKDSSSPFLESAQSIFNRFDFDSPRLVIMAVFPGLIAWLENITHYQFLANSELEFFKKVVLEELERRSIESDSKQDYGDFFQVLFNALQSTSMDGTKSLSLIEVR
uniref:Cytochrome P450 n=1 Tax=Acrobeloides nanus TaxID=290746 RepID=A0A914EIU6_9BILA